MKDLEPVAGNGLLHRRALLRGALLGAMTGYTLVKPASAQKLADDPWSLTPGATLPDVGVRSRRPGQAGTPTGRGTTDGRE